MNECNNRCPNCKEGNYQKEQSMDLSQPSAKVGFCQDCGFCLTSFDYMNIQKRMIADFDGSRYARQLQEGQRGDNKNNYPWVLSSDFITPSLKDNVLIQYLISKFGEEKVYRAAAQYGLESQKKSEDDPWHGAAVFYQLNDAYEKVSYKIMQYDKNGHRIKAKKNSGEEIEVQDCHEEKALLNQKSLKGEGVYCLFGLHLIKRPDAENKKICIVESEKTAIICSIVYPEAIWMAAGSCYYLRENKMEDLYKNGIKREDIILFPDTDAFEDKDDPERGISDWYRIVEEKDWLNGVCVNYYVLNKYGKYKVNDAGEPIIDEEGMPVLNEKDIADYILENYPKLDSFREVLGSNILKEQPGIYVRNPFTKNS